MIVCSRGSPDADLSSGSAARMPAACQREPGVAETGKSGDGIGQSLDGAGSGRRRASCRGGVEGAEAAGRAAAGIPGVGGEATKGRGEGDERSRRAGRSGLFS